MKKKGDLLLCERRIPRETKTGPPFVVSLLALVLIHIKSTVDSGYLSSELREEVESLEASGTGE